MFSVFNCYSDLNLVTVNFKKCLTNEIVGLCGIYL
jgi:hypothetical protein